MNHERTSKKSTTSITKSNFSEMNGMKKLLFLMLLFMSFLVLSCSEDKKEEKPPVKEDVCKDVTCSGHGTCKEVDKKALCECNSGYKNDGALSCIEEVVVTDPCENVTCGDYGSCQVVDEQATCNCESGYHAVGLNCVKDDVEDPCEGISCGDEGSCVVKNDAPSCDCHAGYHEEQLICVKDADIFSYRTLVGASEKSELGISVKVDANDNRWVLGEYDTSLDLGCANSLTSSNDSNAFVAKFSKSGDCLKAINLVNNQIIEPSEIFISNNEIYVLGSFMGEVQVAGQTLTSLGETDIFILKFDADGNYVASQTFGSTGEDYANAIFVENGHVYVGGSFQAALNFGSGITKTPMGGDDLFIAKLDSSLNTTWVYALGSSGNEVVEDIVVQNDRVYAVGEFAVTLDFDEGSAKDKLSPVGGKDGFILAINGEGTYMWARTIGGDYDDELVKIVATDDNHLYVAGSFTEIMDADWGEAEDIFVAENHHDIFITKLDMSGSYANTKQFVGIGDSEGHMGNDWVKDMVFKSNKLYVAGIFSDLLSFNPADENDSSASKVTEGGYDGFLVTLNNEAFESVFTFGSDLDDAAYGLTMDSNGMLVMTGYWQNTANFSPTTNADEKISAGAKDFFLWNYKK